MRPVDVIGIHVDVASGAPLVLLREQEEPHRVLTLFVGGSEATAIAFALSDATPPRPLTHDLMATLVERLDAHVDSAEVTELRDGSFLAELALTGPSGGQRVDTRPSDAIALAMRFGAPLLVSEAVLDEAGTILPDEDDPDDEGLDDEAWSGEAPDAAEPGGPVLDEAEIDAAVARLRADLDQLGPAAFEDPVDDADHDGPV
jgi:bifunctional DNase/RNase